MLLLLGSAGTGPMIHDSLIRLQAVTGAVHPYYLFVETGNTSNQTTTLRMNGALDGQWFRNGIAPAGYAMWFKLTVVSGQWTAFGLGTWRRYLSAGSNLAPTWEGYCTSDLVLQLQLSPTGDDGDVLATATYTGVPYA